MIYRHLPDRRCTPRIKGRYFARYRYYYPQEKRLGIHEHDAITIDISEAGVSLVTDKKVPVGTNLLIKFSVNNELGNTLSSHRKVVVFTGMVVNAMPQGDRYYRLGIYFGPSTTKNEVKFFDIICSSESSYKESGSRRFLQATLHVDA